VIILPGWQQPKFHAGERKCQPDKTLGRIAGAPGSLDAENAVNQNDKSNPTYPLRWVRLICCSARHERTIKKPIETNPPDCQKSSYPQGGEQVPTSTHKTMLREYRARVRRAASLLKAGKTDIRQFDNCFEMHDGDLVVTALVRQAQTDPELAAAMYSRFAYWQTTAQEYALLSNSELAYEARRHIWKVWLDGEKQTAIHRPEYCNVYEVVFDYGGSITFASDLDAIDTASRLRHLGVKFNNLVFRQQRLSETSGVIFTTASAAQFLRVFVAGTGGEIIGQELSKGQLAANNTFTREVDEQIRKVKKAIQKPFSHPLYQSLVSTASALDNL
jgi:hypothetical protein